MATLKEIKEVFNSEKQSKITKQASNLINGNMTDFKKAILSFSKLDLLNLIEEYSLISGLTISEVVQQFKRYFN